jgi:hypothetical protein
MRTLPVVVVVAGARVPSSSRNRARIASARSASCLLMGPSVGRVGGPGLLFAVSEP